MIKAGKIKVNPIHFIAIPLFLVLLLQRFIYTIVYMLSFNIVSTYKVLHQRE